MAKSLWQPARLAILMLLCGGALFTIGRVIVAAPARDTQPSYSLPAAVPLPHWQAIASTPLQSVPESLANRQYQYRQGTRAVDVELHYMLGDGDVNRFLFIFTPIRQENVRLVVNYQAGVGFYGVLPHQGRAYLSACINPRGESTVTEHQFVQNRHTYDLKATRIVPWMTGQQPLLDRRCLWTLISTPLPTNASPETLAEAYKSLEDAWFSWYRWWQPNFPPA